MVSEIQRSGISLKLRGILFVKVLAFFLLCLSFSVLAGSDEIFSFSTEGLAEKYQPEPPANLQQEGQPKWYESVSLKKNWYLIYWNLSRLYNSTNGAPVFRPNNYSNGIEIFIKQPLYWGIELGLQGTMDLSNGEAEVHLPLKLKKDGHHLRIKSRGLNSVRFSRWDFLAGYNWNKLPFDWSMSLRLGIETVTPKTSNPSYPISSFNGIIFSPLWMHRYSPNNHVLFNIYYVHLNGDFNRGNSSSQYGLDQYAWGLKAGQIFSVIYGIQLSYLLEWNTFKIVQNDTALLESRAGLSLGLGL